MDGNTPEKTERRHSSGPIVIQIKGYYPILILAMVFTVTMGLGYFYTNRVDGKRAEAEEKARKAVVEAERKADQRWCGLIKLLDNAYSNPDTPPTTALGQAVADAIHDIRVSLNCPE